jgi:septum formation topological specificity factor MinE
VSQPLGEATPPGNLPLFEGLPAEWNDIVGALPEDKRAELAPKLKSRLDEYEPLKQYEDFHKSGVTAEQMQQALNLSSVIDNHPRQVYEKLAEFLGITPQQAQEVVEEVEEGDEAGDPRYEAMKKQLDVLSQIIIQERQTQTQAQLRSQADEELNKELGAVKKKYGNVDEDQILLYMSRGDMTAEQAYQAYTKRDAEIRTRRPAPVLLGQGQAVPHTRPDFTKMSNEDTKKFVAQMMEHSNQEAKS